ncbi:MAG: hypothetical protein KAY24_17020 [Candidatus Eisenbacteria sp.]|nr:hypothetical protein [Candidatus Eisenbacteria bacterium]
MFRTRLLLSVLVCLPLTTASKPPDGLLYEQLVPGSRQDDLKPTFQRESRDTIWFGGDDGQGIAFEGGIWDWDAIVTDPFQGWISIDMTSNPSVYFSRVTESDFLEHGDPCVPIFPGTTGEIWCGIHEDEADERGFVSGMGYQNNMCQRAFSPEFAIDPSADDIDLAFLFFNDTEPGFDYSYIYILCYDASEELTDEYLLESFDGVIGSPENPASYGESGPEVPAGTLEGATVKIQLELRMVADGGWSDEDGLYPTDCGPFAADDLSIAVGTGSAFYDFEDGPQGWTFDKCEGVDSYMGIVPEEIWSLWVEEAQLPYCTLSGNALECVDEENSPYWPPGHPVGQREMMVSGPVAHAGYDPQIWNTTILRWDEFSWLRYGAATFHRIGYLYYPYTTPGHPDPHWGGRMGNTVWMWTGDPPRCGLRGANLSTLDGNPGDPLPADWDSVKAVYEIVCGCEAFGIPPAACTDEGDTGGTPVIDNFRVGLTETPDAPPIVLDCGHMFHDGFGQNFPGYLEPGDAGNANIAFDLSMSNPYANDWLADTALVAGPIVSSEETRWLVELHFKVTRKGARQDWIQGYNQWKARLTGNPEEDFVCALLDSAEIYMAGHWQGWPHKFVTYFHEDDPGFNAAYSDQSEEQEVLPDGVFVPGTRIEYYYASYWYDGGASPGDRFILGPWEFEILPCMTLVEGEEYAVEWPCVLYVDAYNRGAEHYIMPMLNELDVAYDKYDYLGVSSNWYASMKRSFGGTTYNPGGYGNNGCTLEQLLGYRLILLNTGSYGIGAMLPADFELFEEWLLTTDCGLGDIRRGIIFNGDQIAQIMADETMGLATDFANEVLGTDFVHPSYREYNNDEAYCVYLEPAEGAEFEPLDPGVSLYGNGPPHSGNFNVLGVHPSVAGVTGNLLYYSYEGTGQQRYVEFAQVVRERIEPGVANWKSVVDGVSLHALSERGCQGQPCSADSICIVSGGLDLLIAEFEWLTDPSNPFEPWGYPCPLQNVDEEWEGHLSGAVSFLHAAQPNPFIGRAMIRFHLAATGQVCLEIYDVAGRRVRTLIDAKMEAGDQSIIWDGADDTGRRAGAGLFWMQLKTHDGYVSSKRLLTLR